MAEKEPTITSVTRKQAERLQRDHGAALAKEIQDFVALGRMPDGKFLEIFGVAKNEVVGVQQAYAAALEKLAAGGAADADALHAGFALVAGMVRISSNADTGTQAATDLKKVARVYRKRNELEDAKLSGYDKKRIRGIVAANQEHVAPLEQDAQKWKEAAVLAIDVLTGVGVNTQGYAEALGLGRGKE
ncbi:MAG: hypothetical protein EBV03_03125 [Proteobacteria bacterium]|nr:hypothetical protein [Pseudomonadota bacterium]